MHKRGFSVHLPREKVNSKQVPLMHKRRFSNEELLKTSLIVHPPREKVNSKRKRRFSDEELLETLHPPREKVNSKRKRRFSDEELLETLHPPREKVNSKRKRRFSDEELLETYASSPSAKNHYNQTISKRLKIDDAPAQEAIVTLDLGLYHASYEEQTHLCVKLEKLWFENSACLDTAKERGYFVYHTTVALKPCEPWASKAELHEVGPLESPTVVTTYTKETAGGGLNVDLNVGGGLNFKYEVERKQVQDISSHKILPASVSHDQRSVIWRWELKEWEGQKEGDIFIPFQRDEKYFGVPWLPRKIPKLGVSDPRAVLLGDIGDAEWIVPDADLHASSSPLKWELTVTLLVGHVRRRPLTGRRCFKKEELSFQSIFEFPIGSTSNKRRRTM